MSFLKRFQHSLESLYILPEKSHYVVAYSGGVDSHVLLQCCVALNLPVRAVHIHHGLQTVADDWVEHCQGICEQLHIKLDVIYVDAKKQHRESPEESARKVRYQALEGCLETGDCLLLGQHLNDQAETLLLQLFRSSGAAGLSAMPAQKAIGDNIQLRPLLSFSRNDIEAYAKENKLRWIEDPSNVDMAFDRNFIRAEMLPLMETRWPEITEKLSSAANLQANSLRVMEDMAAIDLANVIRVDKNVFAHCFYPVVSSLSLSKLKTLSSARLLNVLRYWISQLLVPTVSKLKTSVTRNLLEELEQSFVNSQQDTKAVVSFAEYEIRKYQDGLYLLKPSLTKEAMAEICDSQLVWNPSRVLKIKPLGVQLERSLQSNTDGLKISWLSEELIDKQLNVRFRQGGEYFHPAQRKHSQRLKKILQEESIPPWERDLLPLIYLDDELIAISDLWVSKKYVANEDKKGWIVKMNSIR
jgi:tRNA(Ile)-lysidine synthase